jgi:hypothetical protein
MALVKVKPTSPGRRGLVKVVTPDLYKGKLEELNALSIFQSGSNVSEQAIIPLLNDKKIISGKLERDEASGKFKSWYFVNDKGEVEVSDQPVDLALINSPDFLNNEELSSKVVNATFSTYSTFSSSTYADTGLTASITPSSSSNKILVLVHITGMGKSGSNTSMKLQLLRGASSILVFDGMGPYNNTTTAHMVGGTGTTYLDSPATTSSTTYKVQIQSVANTSLVSINDFTTGAAGNCTMTLMEIKG